MKHTLIASGMLMLAFLSSQSFAAYPLGYQPNDLAKLQKTGVCESCDLSSLSIFIPSSDHRSINISGSNFVASGFKSFVDGKSHQNSNFSSILGTKSNLAYLDLSGSTFSKALLLNANLSSSTLSNTDFTGANVSGANFDSTILVGSNISESQLKTVKSYCDAVMPDGSMHKC